jgi:hypothetical protein
MNCLERACKEHAICEVCGCCEEHCPGHLGLRASLKLKIGSAARPTAGTAAAPANTISVPARL